MRAAPNRGNGWTALLLCAALSGCRHEPKVQPLAPQARTPDIFVAPPAEAKLPPMASAPPPTAATDTKLVVAEEVKPKRRPRKVVTPPPAVAVGAPTQTPSTEPPAETARLGALSPSGGSDPQQQQEVAGKIAAVEKRVNELPTEVADREQKQIAKVKLFLKEASDALKAGDAEGAKILATKADLLVDDVQK